MDINGMDDLPVEGETSRQDDPAPSVGKHADGCAMTTRTSAAASPSAQAFESVGPDHAKQSRILTDDARSDRS